MWKRLANAAGLAVIVVGMGTGCRLCDRCCDRRDCDPPRRYDPCDDPCRAPAQPHYYDDCR
jgi:hypothetical protein